MQTSTLALLGGGVVVVAVGAAVYLRPLPPQPEAVEVAAAASVEAPVVAPDGEAGVVEEPVVAEKPDGAEVVEPDTDAVPAVEDPATVDDVAPIVPVLSDLRFEPDGGLVLSGQAAPLTAISVRVDGDEVALLETDASGVFFYVGFLGFSHVARVVSVVGDPGGADVSADRTFVLAANPAPVVVAAVETQNPVADRIEDPATKPEPEPAIEPEPEANPQNAEQVAQATQDVGEGQSDAPQATDAAAPAAALDPAVTSVEPAPEVAQDALDPTPPASPAILAVTDEGVEVVEPAVSDRSPDVMSNVALDTITYAPDGDVVLGGRALGDGFVQVYVDNAPVSRLPVDADGTWRGDLPDVDTGVYTLRIDEVDTDGDVVSRIETPFLREDPVTVAEVLAEEVDDPGFTVATRTVQPGATLWAIAEERYGAGVLYVTVFEANRDRIRNPDLIYPGQVFVLPEDSN